MSDARFRVRKTCSDFWGVYRPYQDGRDNYIPKRTWEEALQTALKLVEENENLDLLAESKEALRRFGTEQDDLGCSECGSNSVEYRFIGSAENLMPLLIAEIEDLRARLAFWDRRPDVVKL